MSGAQHPRKSRLPTPRREAAHGPSINSRPRRRSQSFYRTRPCLGQRRRTAARTWWQNMMTLGFFWLADEVIQDHMSTIGNGMNTYQNLLATTCRRTLRLSTPGLAAHHSLRRQCLDAAILSSSPLNTMKPTPLQAQQRNNNINNSSVWRYRYTTTQQSTTSHRITHKYVESSTLQTMKKDFSKWVVLSGSAITVLWISE
ncbi:hypothetical protein F5148DRAFT_1175610 [Russula earlei]|uniref:Uncharacterized protein n=1 Tax=Russula earlei TaxID=71964 RepID=A0ACC0UII9_9AGAM|nr:hypothetical protein F5148DRAFT_1175610 [Russula earlei]